MKYVFGILCLLASLSAPAFAADTTPPAAVERTTYLRWLKSIGSTVSPFEQKLFAWYEAQRNLPLPNEVAQDSQHLFVSVAAPLAATIELENGGEIEKGVTYGLETYGALDVNIATALQTILFRWGKPVGATEGVTYPTDTVFSYREEHLAPQWGANTFRTTTKKTGGGVAKDMNDVYSLMVRGDDRAGYTLIGSFLSKDGKNNTQTTSFITIVTLRALPDGRTDYRVAGYHMGQSYAFFGIDFGRKTYGFNVDRIRVGQKEFYDQAAELKKTGKISERRP
ncbi:MAG: hypothetical protein ACXVBE_03930 [Bdellovibrionota bacterium]